MKVFRSGLFYAAAGLAVLVYFFRHFGLAGEFEAVRSRIEGLGFWGPAAYALVYAAGTVLAVPGSVMTVAAGSMFGFGAGFLSVSAGSTLGAALAFLIARYAGRGWVERRLAGNEKFRKLDALVLKHGRVVVAVTRLVPLFPFHLLNYWFGLTPISFGVYVFWSWLCMIPGTAMYVAGGEAVAQALKEGRVSAPLAAAFAAAVAIVALLARHFRKIVNEAGK